MRFSIVIATYNRAALLQECLESLMKQDFPKNNYEILVTDDGSTDKTQEYLRQVMETSKVHIEFNTQKNSGPAKARNWGINHAQGEWIVFTDDDCVPPPDWLSKIDDAIKRYPGVIGVSGFQEADEKVLTSNIYAQFEKYANMGDYMVDQSIEHVGGKDFLGGATNNVAYKKSVLQEVGGFDESFPLAASEDADLKKRIVDKGYKLVHINLKVTHKQPYSFNRLMRQAYIRGVGSRHFNIKHGLPKSVIRFLLSSVKVVAMFGLNQGLMSPEVSMDSLFRSIKLLPLVVAYQGQFLRGVVEYPLVMKRLSKENKM